jgi:uncharacterized protein (DUF305 family)
MNHTVLRDTTKAAAFDARLIDSMLELHLSATHMAQQALRTRARPEIMTLAQTIISTNQQHVGQMQLWRKHWYPGLAPTEGIGVYFGEMRISTDRHIPFDERFVIALWTHHRGMLALAKAARMLVDHAELAHLLGNIISVQEAELAQLTAWDRQWFVS